MLPPILEVIRDGQLIAMASQELLTWNRNEVPRQLTGGRR